ncbi:MAG: hypothetical protein KatS3mg102_1783 [Planctomycetota bacterium]|nr:MAG: hypothetical protein KatS3mg102_1783 [Planctomycetota bacterium]
MDGDGGGSGGAGTARSGAALGRGQPAAAAPGLHRRWSWLGDGRRLVLVRPGVLRQVIRSHSQLIALEVPHPGSLVIGREELRRIAAQDGLLLEVEQLADPVLLVAEPGAHERATVAPWALERRVLAQAYHACVHEALERLAASGALAAQRARQLLGMLGHPFVREALRVLAAAERLLPPRTPLADLTEIIATCLELRALAPELLPVWFPSLQPARLEAVLAALGIPLGIEALLGAEAAARARALAEQAPALLPPRGTQGAPAPPVDPSAGSAAAASAAVPPHAAGPTAPAQAAATPAHRLGERLRAALRDRGPSAAAWARALAPLFAALAAGGTAGRHERRLLWELERACHDAELPGVKIDLMGWLCSRGREPLRRSLQGQVPVRVHRYLRAAHARAARLRLEPQARRRLERLLGAAARVAERSLRRRFRPVLARALRAVGLVPANVPEQVAFDKIVEELLDRLAERDYIGFADLRDEVSRNDLKLQDIQGVRQLVGGDPLLRADRRLARELPGVYRRGTFYMRWLQRTSSMFFGTPLGRLLVRFVLLPLGTSLMVLEGVQHMLAPLARALGLGEVRLASGATIGMGAALVLLLLEHRPSRRLAWAALRRCGRGLRWLCWRLPRRLLRHEAVQRLLDSYPVALGRRFVLRPAAVVALLWVVLRAYDVAHRLDWRWYLAGYLAAAVLLDSRPGRIVQAHLEDALAAWWGQITRRVLPELARAVLELSRQVLGWIERAHYAVDELLRIRQRDSRAGLVLKAVFGRLWAVVMYVVQFFVTLLVEPQLNPLKHFPVVTVSHKLLLPTAPLWAAAYGTLCEPALAQTLAWTTVFVLPGLFGFLVWELGANWRLYEATRRARLTSVVIGAHGERMTGMLRPGLHAGTIPKACERWRRRATEAWAEGKTAEPGREMQRLQEAERHLRAFWERELVALWRRVAVLGPPPAVRAVSWGRYRAGVVLAPNGGAAPLVLWIEDRCGRLVASLERAGFARALPPAARAALADALLGVFVAAEVDRLEDWPAEGEPFLHTGPTDGPEVPPVPEAERPGFGLDGLEVPWSAWAARWEAAARPRLAPAFAAADAIVRALQRGAP